MEQSKPGIIPADQRLHADNQAGQQLDLRLKVEFQLIAIQGLPQIARESDAFTHFAIEVIGMEAILVSAFVLGPIESDVGLCEHLVGSLDLRAVGGNPDAHGDVHVDLVEQVRSRQRIHDLRCEHPGVGDVAEIGLQDGKLVTAQTGDEIGLADAALQALADRFQQQIAGRMPERVIDVLENGRYRDRGPKSGAPHAWPRRESGAAGL